MRSWRSLKGLLAELKMYGLETAGDRGLVKGQARKVMQFVPSSTRDILVPKPSR